MKDSGSAKARKGRQRKHHMFGGGGGRLSLCHIEHHKPKVICIVFKPEQVTCLICRHNLGLHKPQQRFDL